MIMHLICQVPTLVYRQELNKLIHLLILYHAQHICSILLEKMLQVAAMMQMNFLDSYKTFIHFSLFLHTVGKF